MSTGCLICLAPIEEGGSGEYHRDCLRRLFGTDKVPHVEIDLSTLPEALDAMVGKISISGVQTKLSLRLSGDRSRLELAPAQGEYILKPRVYDELPVNEAITMRLAQLVGIETADFGLVHLADGSLAYIVRRFDRESGATLTKLRQDDFCQLTGRGPEEKYHHLAEECADIVRRFVVNPRPALDELFLRMLFSYWVGNGDLHLKNLSLVDSANAGYRMSPAYDLVSTWLYGDDRLALYVDGSDSDVRRHNWYAFAAHCEILKDRAESMIDAMVRCHDEAIAVLDRSPLSESMMAKYREVLRKRTKALNLGISK